MRMFKQIAKLVKTDRSNQKNSSNKTDHLLYVFSLIPNAGWLATVDGGTAAAQFEASEFGIYLFGSMKLVREIKALH